MSTKDQLLDVIICTYDRSETLFHCLESLTKQVPTESRWSVTLVNNHPKPLPSDITDLLLQIPFSKSIRAEKVGLSNARNEGITQSNGKWLAFLDDDTRVPQDYITGIMEIIHTQSFDCFGGGIRSWWLYGKPRWLLEDFGSKPDLRTDRGLIPTGYNWGSNIIISREALVSVGMFPAQIGMKAKKLGYAAENLVQIKLREKGYRIGYDPALYIDHIVAKPKLHLSWHISAAYATGRDGRAVFADQYGIMGILKSTKQLIVRPMKSIVKWVSSKNHYWEQVYLDVLIPWALLLGKLRSFF